MGKIKRSEFAAFLNTGTNATPVYELIGDGVTNAKVNYNPQTTEEVYIHQDSGTTDIEAYKPAMPIEATAIAGDSVFDYVDDLRVNRAVLSAAVTDVVLVYLYETPVTGAYPAERQPVAVQIDDFGGEGGSAAKINYTLSFQGDATQGTFNPTTKTFTETP